MGCGNNVDWVNSLNHGSSPSFDDWLFLGDFQKARSRSAAVLLLWHIHMPIHSIWGMSNTLYVLVIEMKNNVDWVNSLNHCSSPSFVAWELPTRIQGYVQAWSRSAAILLLLGHIHMLIHSIWRFSITWYVLEIDVGLMLIWSTASITALHHHLLTASISPEFKVTSTSWSRSAAVLVLWHIHMLIHSIWRMSNTFYEFHI